MKYLCTLILISLAGAACAAAPTQLRVEPFAGDKSAHRVENTTITQNVDGTTTVNTILVYEDGTKENCTIVMKAATAPGNRLMVTPKSRTCTPVP
uniref:Lipoprotein n=1 Tax=Pseudomonas fluorescens (strain SBW25) TaxID=216595 RepID=A0A0G4E4B9_PSEFS|nr:hypothetical protein [Pseudomonas fluorescens]CEK42086.1 hypothetical protein PQBR57_0133 [Pseudomonas fluorescens SBW25]